LRSVGICLSMEAMFSMIVLIMLLVIPAPAHESALEKVYIMQKAGDLMRAWVRDGQMNETAIRSDFEFVFPGRMGEVELERGKVIRIGKPAGKGRGKVAVGGHYMGGGMQLKAIKLTVFY